MECQPLLPAAIERTDPPHSRLVSVDQELIDYAKKSQEQWKATVEAAGKDRRDAMQANPELAEEVKRHGW
jgi:hypothetical protein